jgi:L-ribulose-5-phosphate 4-epimerase
VSEVGSVKFRCEHVARKISQFAGFAELNRYRRKLLDLGMIGVDAMGIGFGNVSIRNGATSRFYITGSATGSIPKLTPADYARVVAYDFAKNWLQCEGSTIASSESLTHAAVYESDATVRAVIHCHDMQLWAALFDKAPTTPRRVEYGTPEMAYAVRRLFESTDVKRRNIFVMAAHDGGLVTFGKDPQEAFGILVRLRSAAAGLRQAEEDRGETKKTPNVQLRMYSRASNAQSERVRRKGS